MKHGTEILYDSVLNILPHDHFPSIRLQTPPWENTLDLTVKIKLNYSKKHWYWWKWYGI